MKLTSLTMARSCGSAQAIAIINMGWRFGSRRRCHLPLTTKASQYIFKLHIFKQCAMMLASSCCTVTPVYGHAGFWPSMLLIQAVHFVKDVHGGGTLMCSFFFADANAAPRSCDGQTVLQGQFPSNGNTEDWRHFLSKHALCLPATSAVHEGAHHT